MVWSLLSNVVAALRAFFVARTRLVLEILALRQQVAVLKRKRPRPKLSPMDRLFWTALRRFRSGWGDTLLIVKPETVAGWHRAGFRLYWRWRSRGPAGGRAKIPLEIRELIQGMARENPTWGVPKIHGELLVAAAFERVDSQASDGRRVLRALDQVDSLGLCGKVGDDARRVHTLVSRTIRYRSGKDERTELLRVAAAQALNSLLVVVVDIRRHGEVAREMVHARHILSGGISRLEVADVAVRVSAVKTITALNQLPLELVPKSAVSQFPRTTITKMFWPQ